MKGEEVYININNGIIQMYANYIDEWILILILNNTIINTKLCMRLDDKI